MICKDCGKEFLPKDMSNDGRCKPCHNARIKQWKLDNANRVRKRNVELLNIKRGNTERYNIIHDLPEEAFSLHPGESFNLGWDFSQFIDKAFQKRIVSYLIKTGGRELNVLNDRYVAAGLSPVSDVAWKKKHRAKKKKKIQTTVIVSMPKGGKEDKRFIYRNDAKENFSIEDFLKQHKNDKYTVLTKNKDKQFEDKVKNKLDCPLCGKLLPYRSFRSEYSFCCKSCEKLVISRDESMKEVFSTYRETNRGLSKIAKKDFSKYLTARKSFSDLYYNVLFRCQRRDKRLYGLEATPCPDVLKNF